MVITIRGKETTEMKLRGLHDIRFPLERVNNPCLPIRPV